MPGLTYISLYETIYNIRLTGSKPCLLCQNVVANRHTEPEEYMQNLQTAVPAKFDLHTRESYVEVMRRLQEAHDAGRDVETLEQSSGFNFRPGSLLYDRSLRMVLDPPAAVFYDWMHCFCASGGVAQYTINEVLRAIFRAELSTLELMDAFARSLTLPGEYVPVGFFKWRYVAADANSSHFRGFAGETLAALEVLAAWLQHVLPLRENRDALSVEVQQCLLICAAIGSLLRMGDFVVAFVELLNKCVLAHFRLFTRLFPGRVTPKLHFLFHT